jgi:hypothetical protein
VPVVSMSKKEFDRIEVLLGIRSGRLRVADACELLNLKRRQVFRLLAGLKHGGAASLVSRRRGAIDVERALGGVEPHLMVTDPPNGVNYDPAWRNEAGRSVNGQTVRLSSG